jgi:AcrR family transcriptional regulator
MPATKTGSDRRQQLLEAAFDQIAENGFEGLRTRVVASAAGIDHSTVHHYFATKQDLIAAVVDYAVSRFRSGEPELDRPQVRLREHLELMARLMREQPKLFTVLSEIDLRAKRDPAIGAIVAARDERWRATLTALFDQPGWHPSIAPGPAAALVIAAVKGSRFYADPADAAAALEQLLELLIPEGTLK